MVGEKGGPQDGNSVLQRVLRIGQTGPASEKPAPSMEERQQALIDALHRKNVVAVGLVGQQISSEFSSLNGPQLESSGLADLANAQDFVSMARALNSLSKLGVIDMLIVRNATGQETKLVVNQLLEDVATLGGAAKNNEIVYEADIPDVMGLKEMFRAYQDSLHPQPKK